MRTNKNFTLILSLISAACVASGCVVTTANPNGSAAVNNAAVAGATATPAPAGASINAGLYIQVTSAWDTTPTVILPQTTCTIPFNSVPGTTATCNLTMPEGQLYFSNLQLLIGSADSGLCKEVIYVPYGFQASSSAGYIPSKFGSVQSALDCSASPVPSGCYNGAAVTEFAGLYPLVNQRVIETAQGLESTFKVPSSFSLFEYTTTSAANFITNPALAQTATNSDNHMSQTYVASSMHGYRAECRDEYYELIYTINFILKSVPYPSTGVISFTGWN